MSDFIFRFLVASSVSHSRDSLLPQGRVAVLHVTLTWESSGTLKGRISTKFNYCINNKIFFFLVHPVLLLLYMNHCNKMHRGVMSHLLLWTDKNLKHTFKNIFPCGLFQRSMKNSGKLLVSISSCTSVATQLYSSSGWRLMSRSHT